MQDIKERSIIVNRIRKNLRQRKALIKNCPTSAYRLYEKDIPEYPYIVDIYNGHAVVYEKGKRLDKDDAQESEKHQMHKNQLIEALQEVLNISQTNVIFKTRARQKGKNQYVKLSKTGSSFNVQENGMIFKVNLLDYLDTGLFLDHRPLRAIIKKESDGKRVLNLFSYTGSISVSAATGNAEVTTVDMSKTYLDWAKENFRLNNIDPNKHTFIQADVIQYIDNDIHGEFDTIILDPPSFSNSKRMEDTFDVQRDHGPMVKKLMKHLAPEGTLYFSNNNRKFSLEESISEEYQVKDMTLQSIPKDFRDLKIHVCFKIQHKKSL